MVSALGDEDFSIIVHDGHFHLETLKSFSIEEQTLSNTQFKHITGKSFCLKLLTSITQTQCSLNLGEISWCRHNSESKIEGKA